MRSFARRRVIAPHYTLALTAGDAQTAVVATALDGTASTTKPKVRVTDATGAAVVGVPVVWAADTGGSVNARPLAASVLTDASGYSTATWNLPTLVGATTLTATLQLTGAVITFTATTTVAAAAIMEAATATDQTGSASTPVTTVPAVRVMDAYRNVVSGQAVVWAVASGGGAVVGGGTTDAFGLATLTSWTLGGSAGANSITATVAGLSGSPVTFTASASAGVPTQLVVQSGGAQTGIVAGQASATVTFRVKDVANAGVQNITVTFSAIYGTPSVSSAASNASGDVTVTLTTDTTIRTDTLLAQFAGVSASTTIASTFGTATKLAITTQPSISGTSGVALSTQPVVEAQDVNGNRVTTKTGTVTATVSSGNASISAGNTKALSSGVATFTGFTVNDSDAGTNIITFALSGLTSALSTGIILAAPIAVKLGVGSQPNNAQVGNVITLTGLVQDQNGTTIPGATDAVTAALTTPGGAVLGGSTTVNAVNGVATFAVTVDTANAYTITLTSGTLTQVVTASFTVSVASASNRPANADTLVGSMLAADQDAASLGSVPPHAVPGITGKAYGSGQIAKALNPLSGLERMRIRWQNNLGSGLGNCNWAIWPNAEFAGGGVRYGALYVRFRQILLWGNAGVDYANEATGTKLTFTGTGVAANNNFLIMMGSGQDNALQQSCLLQWRQQAVVVNGVGAPPTVNRNIAQNNGFANTPVWTVGVPHDLEYYVECNTLASVNGSLGNGKLRVWVDNQLIITKDDMQYRNATHSDNIGLHKWASTWGGDSVGAKTRNDDLWIEDVELYGDLNLKS